jgi:hypothetical protein
MMSYVEPGDIYQWETRLDISHVHPKLYGTGDACIVKVARKTLVTGDFKYGVGIAVDAKDNEQLMTYAIGQRHLYRHHNIKKVILVIVQPRAYHRDGPVRSHELAVEELDAFEAQLRKDAARTDDPGAPTAAGDHCRFCPAAYRCTTLTDKVAQILGIKSVKTIRYEADMPDIKKMKPEDIARVMRGMPIVESWMRRVNEHAHAGAMRGVVPPGMKVVERRKYRKISDVESLKFDLELMGFDVEDYMKPSTLRGVGALESLTGKAKFKKTFGKYVETKSTGFVLAAAEDPRPAVDPDSSKAFVPLD